MREDYPSLIEDVFIELQRQEFLSKELKKLRDHPEEQFIFPNKEIAILYLKNYMNAFFEKNNKIYIIHYDISREALELSVCDKIFSIETTSRGAGIVLDGFNKNLKYTKFVANTVLVEKNISFDKAAEYLITHKQVDGDNLYLAENGKIAFSYLDIRYLCFF